METIVEYAQGLVYNLLCLKQECLSKSQLQCPIGTVPGSTGASSAAAHTGEIALIALADFSTNISGLLVV